MEAQATRRRVIVGHARECVVEIGSDERARVKLRRSSGHPVCGDWVEVSADGEQVVAIAERRNAFPRADRRGRKRIVAANLDRIVVVTAPRPEPTRDLINRYLVAAANVGIPAAVCLNKADLLGPADERHWRALARRYRGLGYPFCRSSTKRSGGLTALRRLLATGTSILVGQSGVGKSSLINRLLPGVELPTRKLSAATGKGRHTTTATTLYRLPGGGEVVDSPGVWEYGIWRMSAAEIARGFVEFAPYLGRCRFADCRHLVEPDCAIEAAARDGSIAGERLDSYRRIVAAIESTAR